MNIHHRPNLDTAKVCEHYSKKDGVPITYVCTSALDTEARAMDIFYRETPHLEFGNKYFGMYFVSTGPLDEQRQLHITNADKIEDTTFEMIEDENGQLHYSQHRHDYYIVDGVSIDGGRAYTRLGGNIGNVVRHILVVRSGLFQYEDEV